MTGEGTAHFFGLDEDPADIARRIAAVLREDRALAMRQRVVGHYTWQSVLQDKLEPLILSASRSDDKNAEGQKTGKYRECTVLLLAANTEVAAQLLTLAEALIAERPNAEWEAVKVE